MNLEEIKFFLWEARNILILFLGFGIALFACIAGSNTSDNTYLVIILIIGICIGFYGFLVESEYQYMTIEEKYRNPSLVDKFLYWFNDNYGFVFDFMVLCLILCLMYFLINGLING